MHLARAKPSTRRIESIAVVLPIGTARLYDLKTGKEERLAEADEPAEIDDARPMGGAVAVRFSPDGRDSDRSRARGGDSFLECD